MSAIWGVVALDGKGEIPASAKEIFEATYKKTCKIERYESISDTKAYIGCGIQYITAEAEREVLPIIDKERGIIFTADCMLDNRKEVIERLVTYGYDEKQLRKEPDGSLMYHAYCCMGKACAKEFRGLFAIAIWNEPKGVLTLMSDPVATRCLYYIRRGNLIAFSTLMEPLVKLFPDMEQNINYYKDFLLVNPSVIYVVPGETPYKEISLMLPATELELSKNGEKFHTYWTLQDSVLSFPIENSKNLYEYGTRFLELYDNCVRDALRTSGEVGISMSSGLDSSSIGVLAARELKKDEKKLYSYTFMPYDKLKNAIVGNSVYDESGLVKQIVEMYPNIKPTFLNNNGKNIFEDMNFLISLLEMPYKTGTFSNHYEMCNAGAKAGCKVFLNGGFGNNTVSYGEIQHVLYDFYKKKHLGSFLQYLNRYAKHEKVSRRKMLTQMIKSFSTFDKSYEKRLEHFVPNNIFLIPSILKNYDLKERFATDKRILVSEGYIDSEKYEDHLKATGLLMYLGIFETKFGLHTGMLLRDPTKDIRMMSFCYQLPYHMFAYQGMTRWLVRNQFEKLLPKALLDKWQQRGVLNMDWLNHIYRDWDRLKLEFLENLSVDMLDEWIDKRRVRDVITCFGENIDKDKKAINYLCAIDSLCRYIKLQK